MTGPTDGDLEAARLLADRIRAHAGSVDPDDLWILKVLPSHELAELLPLLLGAAAPADIVYGNALVAMVAEADLAADAVPVEAIIDQCLSDQRSVPLDHAAWILSRADIRQVTRTLASRLESSTKREPVTDLLSMSARLRNAPPPVLGAGETGEGALRGSAWAAAEADDQWRSYEGGEPDGDDGPQYRYANVLVVDRDRDVGVDTIGPGDLVRVRVDIGPLGDTNVRDPEPLPEEHLPNEPLWLDLMLTSLDFELDPGSSETDRAPALHSGFLLPADRALPALTDREERFVYFPLAAPPVPKVARARLGIYFRDALVQSFVLAADLATREFTVESDFRVSKSLAHLGAIADRPRVSVFVNDNHDGLHTVVARSRDEQRPRGTSFEVQEAGVRAVATLREKLTDRAPGQRQRDKRSLVRDLQTFAPEGHRMYQSFRAGLLDTLVELWQNPEAAVLSITRPTTSTFSLPWALIYDIGLDEALMDQPTRLDVCPIVTEWDGESPLVAGDLRQCPKATEVNHRLNLLCPFGFWGFRYSIESVSTRDQTTDVIRVPARAMAAASVTRVVDDMDALRSHLGDLENLFQTRLGLDNGVAVAQDRDSTYANLEQPLSLVYFYCHGERTDDESETYLAVGNHELIPPTDLVNRIFDWTLDQGHRPWRDTGPLVFINACHSLEIKPTTTMSYVDAFVAEAHASGVIGTEVKVEQGLAREFAGRFFELLLGADAVPRTVDEALRQTRLEFLASGNLFGLVYTPHCWATLRFEGLH